MCPPTVVLSTCVISSLRMSNILGCSKKVSSSRLKGFYGRFKREEDKVVERASVISLLLELPMKVLTSLHLAVPSRIREVSTSWFFIAEVGELYSLPFGLSLFSSMTIVFIMCCERRTLYSCVLICFANETEPQLNLWL